MNTPRINFRTQQINSSKYDNIIAQVSYFDRWTNSPLIREFQIYNCREIACAIFTIDSIFIFKIQFIYLQF